MKINQIIILIVLASLGLSYDTWTRKINTPIPSQSFPAFLGEGSGISWGYSIFPNNTLSVPLYLSQENDSQLRLLVMPTESIGMDRRLARTAIIYAYSTRQIEQGIMLQERKTIGKVTLLPNQKLMIQTSEVTIQLKFSTTSPTIIIVTFFIQASVLYGLVLSLWWFRLKYTYFGFQLISVTIRWFLKMMIFDEINGWNYYFPNETRPYWKGFLVIMVALQVYGTIQIVKQSQSWKQRLRIIMCLELIFIPETHYSFFFVVLIVVEICYQYKSQKLLKPLEPFLILTVILFINIAFAIYFSNPQVLFEDETRSAVNNSIFWIMLVEMMIFCSQLGIYPHVFLWAILKFIWVDILFFCCRSRKSNICRLCGEVFELNYEKYLAQKMVKVEYTVIAGTPCGHVFHKKCLKDHVEKMGTCPIENKIMTWEWIYDTFGDETVQAVEELLNKNQVIVADEIEVKVDGEDKGDEEMASAEMINLEIPQ